MSGASFTVSRPVCVVAVCLCLLSLAYPRAAAGAASGDSICVQTAARAFAACGADVASQLQTAVGNCLQVQDDAERRECRAAAAEAATEGRGECVAQREARRSVCALLGEQRYQDPFRNPALAFIDPNDIPGTYPPNPFVSLAAGQTWVMRAGEDFEETVVIHVTPRTREIDGVTCRVVLDVVLLRSQERGPTGYEPVEVTDDWFAQDQTGDVYYCGELVRNFEDGSLRDLGGSFEAGRDAAKAGTLIRFAPVVGEAHRQEFALGEAEDVLSYRALSAAPAARLGGENPAFPCQPGGCLETREFNPLEPHIEELKFYRRGVGVVLEAALENGRPTGERDELVCAGDSLEVLRSPSCGIADADELLETLCGLSPESFCPGG